ncbi:MAG: methenyltetrahydromethanopterin cyclohydrolase [Candidatus Cloacimonetes bacterium]|nr:methenyltetrahydromethanopterin cyclohydrolase [Candidatus Cloacimonadota bacterium]
MVSVNREAFKLVKKLIVNQNELKINVDYLNNGTTVIDLGQNVEGSWEAGRLLTKILLGGLGNVSFETFPRPIFNSYFPAVNVRVDHPLLSLAGCQISGWELSPGNFAPILAGPGRTLGRKENDWLSPYIDYQDNYDKAILTVESPDPITLEQSEELANACNIDPDMLYILIAPPASLATYIQVSGRILEQTLHRLKEEEFNLECIKQAQGFCVIPPLIDDDLISMGRMNDALIYGGHAQFTVKTENKQIEDVIEQIMAVNSKVYGRPFKEIFKEADLDFYNVPKELFSPASVSIVNEKSGKIFKAGKLNIEILEQSFSDTVKK